MGVGGYYLAVRVANIMAPTVRAYGDCVRRFFLPVFDDLNTKAEEVANQAYDELMQQPVTDEMDDPGDAAEAANQRGQEFYDTMFAMRQSTLNMFTAGLFHLLEQQLASLGEDATFQAMGVPLPEVKLDETAMWYHKYLRLDLTGFPEWTKITEELRRIANAVKHGEGPAARRLRELRPDLFIDPRLAQFGLGHLGHVSATRRLSTPLAGDDLFVTREVFDEYTQSVVSLLQGVKEYFLLHRDDQYPDIASARGRQL